MLTSSQLSEWEAYDKIDPTGDWREDYNSAAIQAILVNLINGLGAKKGEHVEPVTALDMMIDWSGERPPRTQKKKQSVEEQKSFLLGWAHAYNRAVKRGEVKPVQTKKKR